MDPDGLLAGLPGDAPAGRPHLARALVSAGVVDSVSEAFYRYLTPDGPYYAGRADTDAAAAVRMVRAAGGVPVLAHAMARRRGPVVGPEVIAELAAEGLAGLEADHPDHTEGDRAMLRDLAGELDLLITGSSDYHGANKTVRLGQETTHMDPGVGAGTGWPMWTRPTPARGGTWAHNTLRAVVHSVLRSLFDLAPMGAAVRTPRPAW